LLKKKIKKSKIKKKFYQYTFCMDYYRQLYFMFTIPSMILTTAISVIAAVWPEGYEPFAQRVVIASLGAVATLLTSILALYGFQEKYGKFEISAQLLESLSTRIDFHLYGQPTKKECLVLLSELGEKMNEIRSTVPPLSPDLIRKSKAFVHDMMDSDDEDDESDGDEPPKLAKCCCMEYALPQGKLCTLLGLDFFWGGHEAAEGVRRVAKANNSKRKAEEATRKSKVVPAPDPGTSVTASENKVLPGIKGKN
jgi:hypothetical protein